MPGPNPKLKNKFPREKKNMVGMEEPKPPKFKDLDIRTQKFEKERRLKPKYKTGGKVKLALKGGGRAFGKNS